MQTTFEEFWTQCLSIAYNDKQRQIMWRCKNLYWDYWEQGKSAEEAMEEEWG